MATHRPLVTAALRRHPDPSQSTDPQIRELLAALSELEIAPAPRAQYRAELRAQIVAIAPRLTAETAEAAVDAAPQATSRRARSRAARRPRLARPLAILASLVAIVALVLGGAVWISHKALPGDALYGLKRASENLQQALTRDSTAKGKLLLSFAATRYDEAGALLPASGAYGAGVQAAGGQIDQHTASLVESTLTSADGDVQQGMQSLGARAIKDQSGSIMSVVIAWNPGPRTTLQGVVARIPSGSLHHRAATSLSLLDAVTTRAQQIQALGDCTCLSSTSTDSLGPVPCTNCSAVPATTSPGHPSPGSSAPTSSVPGSSASTPTGTATPTAPGGLGSSTNPGGATDGAPTSGSPGSSEPSDNPVTSEPGQSSSPPPTPPPTSTTVPPPPSSSEPGESSSSVPPPSDSSSTDAGGSTMPSCSTIVSASGISVGTCDVSISP